MTPEEAEATRYRFSGYQLPKIILDETGPSYIRMEDVHPYFKNQPQYWQTPAFQNGHVVTPQEPTASSQPPNYGDPSLSSDLGDIPPVNDIDVGYPGNMGLI